MAIKLLILQGVIPHYRVPIFDALGREFELTLAHSDPLASVPARDFRVACLRDIGVGGFHYQQRVAALARDHDVVIAMFDLRWLSSLQLCLESEARGFVWWGHGFGRSRIARALRTAFVRRADALLLYDEAARHDFEARGIAPEGIFVAPNTVEVAHPFVTPDASARKSFLFVGRLQQRKRIDLLIEAFGAVVAELPSDIGVEIVGEGPELSSLESQVVALGLRERVTFHGGVTDENALRDIFGRALAYVSPGHVGLGILHAGAYGVPVVTQPSKGHGPEISNLRDGETGLLVTARPGALSEVLLDLAIHRDRAHAMGLAAHQHYTGARTLRHMLDGFGAAVDFALARSGRTPSPRSPR